MEKQSIQNNLNNQEPNLREQLEVYLRHWFWFIFGVFLALVGAYLYLRYSTPLFKTTTSIIIKDSKGRGAASELAAFEDIGLISGMNANSIENEIEILRSKRLFRNVVDKLDLHIRYFTEGNIKTTEVYSGKPFQVKILEEFDEEPFPQNPLIVRMNSATSVTITNPEAGYSKEAGFGERIEFPFGAITLVPDMERMESLTSNKEILVQFKPKEAMVSVYQSRIQVNPIARNSSVIEMTLNDPVKEKAQDILNELVLQYNRDAIDDRNLVANNTASFIDERLNIITSELDSVETDKVTFKQDNRITSIQAEAQLFLESASEFSKSQIAFQTQRELVNDLLA